MTSRNLHCLHSGRSLNDSVVALSAERLVVEAAKVSVAVENFGTAEVTAGLFLLNVFRKNSAELIDVLDILNFKYGTSLILRMYFDGAKTEELLEQRALYAHILYSVKKNFVLNGVEKADLVNELLGRDGVGCE